MRALLFRQLLSRIALAISLIVLGGAVVSAVPLNLIEQQEKTEEETPEAKSPPPSVHESTTGRHRETPRTQAEQPSVASLFAVYRQSPPAPLALRGPDALSAPVPHPLN